MTKTKNSQYNLQKNISIKIYKKFIKYFTNGLTSFPKIGYIIIKDKGGYG